MQKKKRFIAMLLFPILELDYFPWNNENDTKHQRMNQLT